MQVYTLPETNDHKVLLTGDLDFVLEFASVLSNNSIVFSILPPMDALDELDLELDLSNEAMSSLGGDLEELATEEYGDFAKHVLADVRDAAGTFTHIVDLSVAPPMERRATLEIASMLNPNATVFGSTLTNTATELGFIANVPDRICGVGLAPSVMSSAKSIDIAGGLNCSTEHLSAGAGLLRALGYEVEVVEDRVALVQMRVLATLINEAAYAVMEGVATAEDIDSAMKLGVNYPKGLLAWADEIGIPIVTLVLDGLYNEYQQERYRPCVLLKQYMRAGWHGKDTGRGFYTYAE